MVVEKCQLTRKGGFLQKNKLGTRTEQHLMNYDIEEQYQSVVRALKRVRALATDIGKTVVIGDHTAKDAAKSFFMDCYHLKDWLKKDSRIQNPQDVEAAIRNGPSLSLVADLCNSLKHAGLNRPPKSGKQLERINMAYSLDLPASTEPGTIKMARNPADGDTITISRSNRNGPPVATAKLILTVGGQKHDAISIAAGGMREWEAFLASKGIHFSRS